MRGTKTEPFSQIGGMDMKDEEQTAKEYWEEIKKMAEDKLEKLEKEEGDCHGGD